MINSQDLTRFREDGVLHVKGLLDTAEIDRFRAAIDQTIARRGQLEPPMAKRSDYEMMFTQNFNLWEDSKTVRELTFHPRIAEVASALIDAPVVRVYCDQSFYKDPGSTETRAHQDYPLFGIAETNTLNAWIPLQPVDQTFGAVGYVKGSHKFGTVTNLELALGRDPCSEQPLKDMMCNIAYFDAGAGDVVFHHVATLHVACSNQTTRIRKAFAITYFADGSTRGTACPHASVDRMDIQTGEVIRGPATPIVWPEPDALPQPPAPMQNPPRGWPRRGLDSSDD